MHRSHGLTLLEVLVVTSLLALLASLALPHLEVLVLDSRMTTAANTLVHSIHLARQAAITSVHEVVLCRSTDGEHCLGAGDWTNGWMVFTNLDQDSPPTVDAGEPVLQVQDRQHLSSVTSNRASYIVRPFPQRSTNGTVVFCDRRGAAHARAVILSYSGRPRISRHAPDGRPLHCPP